MKVLLFANTDWYLYNFRRSLALALRDAGHEVLLLSPDGPYGEKLRALGLRWIAAPLQRRSLNPLREVALVLWLWRFLSQEKVDLVHSFTIKGVVYGSLAARFAKVPARVNAVEGMGYVFTSLDLKARILRPIVRALLRLALRDENARLILLNKDDLALFEQNGLLEAKQIRLIPGAGVDCDRFRPKTERPGSPRIRVLLAARILWDKGVAEYVQASQELRFGRRVDFLLAGEPDTGNPASVPEATIKVWDHDALVEWIGHVEDMPRLYQSVDIVVLPSYREGLPTGLIEAGACGLPLITTDVPGCREVVTHEVNGLLVPAKDPKALAHAIARLCDDPVLRSRLGAAAREKVLAEFDEKIVIQKTLAVYAEVCDKNTP